jgi:putative ABC transport system permease protein
MIRIILAGFLRSLARHRLYAAINIGGLAVGIAVFIVLGLYVRFETSFNAWLPNYREIYVLEETSKDLDRLGLRMGPPMALIDIASHEIPGLVAARSFDPTATVIQNGVGQREKVLLVDPNLFDAVSLPVERGDARHALSSTNGLLITHRIAQKYFGTSDPLGKRMTLSIDGIEASYRVGAILKDLPANSEPTFKFDLMTRLTNNFRRSGPYYEALRNWRYRGPPPFVKVASPEEARRLERRLEDVLRRWGGANAPGGDPEHGRLHLRPISSLHLRAPGSVLAVTTLGVVGLLTLLIAVVNYINLATARAGLRAREVAMRKVLGADRTTLFWHFMGEALMTSAIAGFVGLALAESTLPLIDAAGGLELQLRYLGPDGVLLPLMLLTALVGGFAGVYPAVVLSRWPAAAVLAAARTGGAGRAGTRVREGLVVFQFAVATAFLISIAVMVMQTSSASSRDQGFDREGLLILPTLNSSDMDAGQRARLLDRLSALPGVSGVAQSNTAPGGGGAVTSTHVSLPGVSGERIQFQFFAVTPPFFGVVGARLSAGRLFEGARSEDMDATDHPTAPRNVVINSAGARALGFASPETAIGKTVVGGGLPKRIIGVIEDMRFDSPRVAIEPTFYVNQVRDPIYAVGLVRFSGNPEAVLGQVRGVWRQVAPEVPFKASTAEQQLQKLSDADDKAARMFFLVSALAVMIACVGLWGLASFNTTRRAREIGIRKTLGASSLDILMLLVGQFIRPVLIANLLAWPLAYFAMKTWLAGFDDPIDLSPFVFFAAAATVLAIAVVTVIGQSLRAARAAPAWILRYD